MRSGAGVVNAALICTYGVLQSGVSATGEEIGWRGFLVPVLAQCSSLLFAIPLWRSGVRLLAAPRS